MGVLTDDDGLVDAALAEILALPIEKRHERDPQRDVDYLLTQYHVGQVSDGTLSTHITRTHHFRFFRFYRAISMTHCLLHRVLFLPSGQVSKFGIG